MIDIVTGLFWITANKHILLLAPISILKQVVVVTQPLTEGSQLSLWKPFFFFFFLLNCFPIILTLTYIVRGTVELNESKAI